MSPTVSIVMPYYDSPATLPMAVASLLAQTFEDWELIFVDDGSEERPDEMLASVTDPRIRTFRLDRNRGRGAARQFALDHSEGRYLCMLDADDWIFPDRLERQVEVLASEPSIDLLSGGLAVVDRGNRLLGVRRLDRLAPYPATYGPLTEALSHPVAHAPSMIRIAAAKRAGYDTSARAFEDREFLLQIVRTGRFAILPGIFYVYLEVDEPDLATMLASYRSARQVYRAQQMGSSLVYLLESQKLGLKSLAYRLACSVGLGHQLVRRRSASPTFEESAEFEAARAEVERARDRWFPSAA